ncbi:unnamed protein product [Parascedosporium putredinis]|uniref:Glutathione S-transferase n=1 Tax=Parascedosporium putredinis TaxID=1442378 RepID=A0A9P1HB93_9PEZI|nr:unnamed protein product [Parascedosporium putredinis]CAI8002996.1 unnamed protein product [Parascedosporium putredinis]
MSPSYELIYWPGLPGRGEFVRLVLEEAGVDADNLGDASNPPPLAPPILRHGDLLISQTPNILLYLASRHNLAPAQGAGFFHLNGLALTALDGLSNEVHETHHPVSVSDYYENQKEESKRRAADYTKNRLPKFLGYFEKVLRGEKSGDGPWLYGGALTYVDLVLFQNIDGLKYAFPNTVGKLEASGEYDNVFKLYQAVKDRPRIKEYLASERRQKYSNGIYRHYPELDGE